MIPIKHPCQISYPIFPPPKNTKRGRCQTGAWRRTSNLFSAVWGISCLHRCAKFGPPQLGTPKFGKFWNHFGEYLLASTSIYQHLPWFWLRPMGYLPSPIVQASEPAATVAPTAPAGAPKAGRWTKKHGKNGEIPQWNLQKSHGNDTWVIHEERRNAFFRPFPVDGGFWDRNPMKSIQLQWKHRRNQGDDAGALWMLRLGSSTRGRIASGR